MKCRQKLPFWLLNSTFFNATVGFLSRVSNGICLLKERHTVTSTIGSCYELVTRLNQFLEHTHMNKYFVSMQYAQSDLKEYASN